MNEIIMWIMAVCAVIGGVDYILGNRFKLGAAFEKAFGYLGPMGLSMTGIICLAPVLSNVLGKVVTPLFTAIGVDPAMFAGIFAIDLGGYQMAKAMALDPLMGDYSGVIVAAILGCTVTFTIPVGLGMMEEEDRPLFSKGMIFGLIAMPVALAVGGLMCGMNVQQVIWQNMPMLMLSLLLLVGIWKAVDKLIRGFSVLAAFIRALAITGLMLGAFSYLSETKELFGMAPVMEGMEVVSSVGIVLLGSLPFAEILQRIMKKPLAWVGRVTGMNSASVAGLVLGMVGPLLSIALLKDMDKRGKICCGAYLVCGASVMAAHLGFTAGVAPHMVAPMVISKIVGGYAGVLIALLATRKEKA